MPKATKNQIKQVKELIREKKARDESGLFVAEGVKIIKDIIAKGHMLQSVIVSSGFIEKGDNKELLSKLADTAVPVFSVPTKDIEKLSDLKNSQGILAIIKKPYTPKITSPQDGGSLVVMCDGIQDPGNLGTMVRTMVAFGVSSMLIMGDAVDVYNPKVVRASSGMVMDVYAHTCDIKELDRLKGKGYRLLIGKIDETSKNINDMKKIEGPVILAFGNEGRGVSKEVEARSDGFFYIPIDKTVESLNVTAAAAISLYVFRLMGTTKI